MRVIVTAQEIVDFCCALEDAGKPIEVSLHDICNDQKNQRPLGVEDFIISKKDAEKLGVFQENNHA